VNTGANRWFLYGPFLAAGVILAGWRLLWQAGAATMREHLEEFAAAQSAEGSAVAYEPLVSRGFPFFLRGVTENFSIARGDARYECDRLYIDALPYAPGRIIFSCGAEQRLIIPDGAWTINAKDARASIERDEERGWMAKADTGGASAFRDDVEVSVGAATVNFAPGAADPALIDVSMRIVKVGVTRPASGYALDRIDAAVSLSGGAPAERTVDVHGLEAIIGETVVRAKGKISLLADGDARGRLNARVEKPVGLARALADARLLDAEEAKAAETGLAMFAVASGGAITAPIDLENGEVRLAGLLIANVKPKSQP
jgi:hypothetical protein